MKIIGIWAGVKDGIPQLNPDLKQSMKDAEQVSEFLDRGTVVLRVNGFSKDWMSPEQPKVVPIGFSTDGVYIWSNELVYYIENYGINLPNEFISHIREQGYLTNTPTEEQLETVKNLLLQSN